MQPGQGTTYGSSPLPELPPPEVDYTMIGDFGPNHREQIMLLTSMDDFYQTYFPEITVGDQRIALSAALPPTPVALVKYLKEQSGSRFGQLDAFLTWIRDYASNEEIEQLRSCLQAVPLLNDGSSGL